MVPYSPLSTAQDVSLLDSHSAGIPGKTWLRLRWPLGFPVDFVGQIGWGKTWRFGLARSLRGTTLGCDFFRKTSRMTWNIFWGFVGIPKLKPFILWWIGILGWGGIDPNYCNKGIVVNLASIFNFLPRPIVRKPILPLASKQDRLEAGNCSSLFFLWFFQRFFRSIDDGDFKGIFKLEIFLVDAEWILRGRWWQLAYMIALQ